jgi:RNA polymerase sigma-70 factor, ECF subfamily
VLDPQDEVHFEMFVLPHLDAAFNLARWLLRSGADAEDVAQEAMLRRSARAPKPNTRNACYRK